MAKSVAATLTKWANNTAGATQAYKDGVMAVREAPGAKAAAQVEAYKRGTQASAAKFAARVGAVSLAQWQQLASTKGAQNLATGVDAAKPKMQAFLTQFLPHVEAVRQQLNASTPRGEKGSQANKQRMIANMEMMQQFQRT